MDAFGLSGFFRIRKMILPVFPNVEGIADCRFRTVMKTAEAKGAEDFPGGVRFSFRSLDRTLFRARKGRIPMQVSATEKDMSSASEVKQYTKSDS